ncbi:MAG: hypothetical protein IPP34_16740 [Bacteroidetes bacterium]|nr:hypothetical protein [Bacteroidota bacterium]
MFNLENKIPPNGPNAREFLGMQLSTFNRLYSILFSAKINFSGGPTTIVASNKFGMKLLTYDLDLSSTVPELVYKYSNNIFQIQFCIRYIRMV